MVPQITLKGSAYEKGFLHGSLAKDQVLCSIRSYKRSFLDNKQLSWERAQELAERFLPVFTGKYEKYLEEMKGIAEGAGVPFSEILALNLRSELLFTSLPDEEDLGCTAFSAVPPATADGAVLAGQSWDFRLSQRDAAFIARIPADGDSPAILMFLEGGLIGGKGVNDAGLSITLNALHTKGQDIGVPLHLRMRRALECRFLSDAYAEVAAMPIPVPANLILTHKDGLSLSLELDPSGVDVLQPENGVIVHTNHFLGPRMQLSHAHRESASTYIRYQRMKALTSGKKDLTMEDMEAFYRDHAGYPASICMHPHPSTPADHLPYAGATNHAFVADLTRGIVRFVFGNPCEGEFTEIKING